MNREEILAKSRNDNKGGDEREKKIRLTSLAIGSGAAVVLCIILSIIEEFVFDRSSTALWVIAGGMLFFTHLTQAIKLKQKICIVNSVTFGIWFFSKLAAYIIENLR